MYLLGHHHLDELLVVDLTVAVNIGLANHLIDLLVREFLSEVGHDVTKLGSGDETISVLIEDLESLKDLLLRVSVLHLTSHHGKELREIDGSVSVGVDLVDHIGKLGLRGVLSKRSHDSSQLLGGDRTISVLIEQGESFLEFSDLFFGELISHFSFCGSEEERGESVVQDGKRDRERREKV